MSAPTVEFAIHMTLVGILTVPEVTTAAHITQRLYEDEVDILNDLSFGFHDREFDVKEAE